MKNRIYFILFVLAIQACQSQTKTADEPIKLPKKLVGGACEGCQAVFEYGNQVLNSIDTLPKFEENSPKLTITGTVFLKDGKTPAEGVIIYIYHTNRNGLYETHGDEQGWAKRHGIFRGWVKTGTDGSYTFYTFRPAAYPNRAAPEHIHMTVKEPNRNEYFIDNIQFDDDPLLTESERKRLKNRGGSGITQPTLENQQFLIKRDIILGLNIPDYEF